MKRFKIILAMLLVLVLTAGCTGGKQEPAPEASDGSASASVEEVQQEPADESVKSEVTQEEIEAYSGLWFWSRELENGGRESFQLTLAENGDAKWCHNSPEREFEEIYLGSWQMVAPGTIEMELCSTDEEETVETGSYWVNMQGDDLLMKRNEGFPLVPELETEEVVWLKVTDKLGYVTLGECSQDKAMIVLNLNEVVWVGLGDQELIRQYGLSEDLDGYDYEIVDEEEDWEPVSAFENECMFAAIDRGERVVPVWMSAGEFCGVLLEDVQNGRENGRLCKCLMDQDGLLLFVEEIYVP